MSYRNIHSFHGLKKLFILAITIISTNVWAGGLDQFFRRTDAFLKKYVSNGEVAYSNIKQHATEIDQLYKEIGDINISSEHDNAKKAFYINVYNIIVIYAVVKQYPIQSPLDDAGFFDNVKHRVAGKNITLNELEKEWLLKTYQDARLHFVLVCAARSCPPLASFAYTADNVEQQLTERTVLTLNTKNWIKVYPSQKTVAVSKIFEWYLSDFASNPASLLAWINQYRKEKIPQSYAVSYYEYDWSLNGR
jgi:hypothetical protein